jgi:hypothetical protein
LLRDLKPKAVVGFGGYPTVPPLFVASGTFPTVIHEQNAVMGRANRLLSHRVTAIAGGFMKAEGAQAAKIVETGNPVRPAVIAAVKTPFDAPKTMVHRGWWSLAAARARASFPIACRRRSPPCRTNCGADCGSRSRRGRRTRHV